MYVSWHFNKSFYKLVLDLYVIGINAAMYGGGKSYALLVIRHLIGIKHLISYLFFFVRTCS